MKQKTMSAVIWDGGTYPDSLSYGEVDVQKPEAGWVQFKTEACGICGSDTHLIAGDNSYLIPRENFPAVMGHENAGVVVETGPGVSGLSPGDRIAVEPLHGCLQFGESCSMCESGNYHLCLNGLVHVGLPMVRRIHGGFGEYSVAHASRCFPIPKEVKTKEAATLDVLAVCVHALNIAPPPLAATTVVMGCGIVGLEMIQILRAAGIRTIVAVAKYQFQAEKAIEKGASHTIVLDDGVDPVEEVKSIIRPHGADYVYECVGGNTDAVQQSLYACTYGGTVVMVGGAARPRPIDLQDMILKEHKLVASMSYAMHGTRREFQIALDLLATGQVKNADLITHTFRRDQYREAFDTAVHKREHRAFKVMFVS